MSKSVKRTGIESEMEEERLVEFAITPGSAWVTVCGSRVAVVKCCPLGSVRDRRINAGVHEAPWILNSALLSVIEALLLHGETCPVTGLPARATSAASDF